jgi:Mn2+/Fe2+ NRAMP family transporter
MAETDRRVREPDRARESHGRGPLRTLSALGPGLVSGAADVDPTTVATVAVVGSTTVYSLSWLAWLLFPMIAVVLVIATQVGVRSRRDLQQCVRDRYSPAVGWLVAISIVVVNVLTIAADLHGASAALGLLIGRTSDLLAVPVAVVVVALLCWGSLNQVQRVLKYVLLCLLAYPVAAVLASPDWTQVLIATVLPHFSLDADHVSGALAMLGTTLTSYVYLWQTMEQAEDRQRRRERLRAWDAVAGALGTVVVFWFILIATGATLGIRHEPVNTAEQAAQALAPIAGPYAADVFGIGLLVSALVALPVLLATTGHVVAVQLGVPSGLPARPRRAPAFTGVIVGAAVLALAVIIGLHLSPMRLLVLASIVGGMVTPVGLVALMLLSRDRLLLGRWTVHPGLRAAGWVVTVLISVLTVIYLVQQFAG